MSRSTGRLEVLKSGALVCAQDTGRIGGQHLGICQSGAADSYSYYWSNTLLGNSAAAAVLEVCLGGFEIAFQHATKIAVCGADMALQLNRRKIENWSSHNIEAGDILRMSYARRGLRCYLAVLGGFLLEGEVFGSIASVPRESLGFNLGQPLSPGMSLSYRLFNRALPLNKALSKRFIPDYSTHLNLSIYPAYQHRGFDDEQRRKFCSGRYTVASASDRMGYRLKGEPIEYSGKKIVSEGIALGAVQIPADGQPIILLNDRQTIGGYPKIGCVTQNSCSKLAQLKPGEQVSFTWQGFSS